MLGGPGGSELPLGGGGAAAGSARYPAPSSGQFSRATGLTSIVFLFPAAARAVRFQRFESRGQLSAFPQLDHARKEIGRGRVSILEKAEVDAGRPDQPGGRRAVLVEPELRSR